MSKEGLIQMSGCKTQVAKRATIITDSQLFSGGCKTPSGQYEIVGHEYLHLENLGALISDATNNLVINVTAGDDALSVVTGPVQIGNGDFIHFWGDSIDFTVSPGSAIVRGEVKLSADAGNAIALGTDGGVYAPTVPDIYVDGGTFNPATLLLTLTDTDGVTPDVVVNLGSLQGSLTNNGDGTYLYNRGDGVTTVLDTRDGISADAGNLLAIGSDARPFLDTSAIQANETTTVLSGVLATGNPIGVYTNEDGVVATLSETITTFSFDALAQTLTFVGEDGVATVVDITQFQDTYITAAVYDNITSTLTLTDNNGATTDISVNLSSLRASLLDNGDGTYLFDNGAGVTTVVNTLDGVSADLGNVLSVGTDGRPYLSAVADVVTTLVDNGDGTYVYTNEIGVASVVDTRDGVSADAGNSLLLGSDGLPYLAGVAETVTTLVDNGDGTFTYSNEAAAAITFDAHTDANRAWGTADTQRTNADDVLVTDSVFHTGLVAIGMLDSARIANTALSVSNSTTIGAGHTVSGAFHLIAGSTNNVSGGYHGVFGTNNTVSSYQSVVTGDHNTNSGQNNLVGGQNNYNVGSHGIVSGYNNSVSASMSVTIGQGNAVTGGGRSFVTGFGNAGIAVTDSVVAAQSIVSATGNRSLISGIAHTLTGVNDSVVAGATHNVTSSQNAVFGSHQTVSGSQVIVSGTTNTVSGSNNVVTGSSNSVTGGNSFVGGYNNTNMGMQMSLVVGHSHAYASGNRSLVGGYHHVLATNDSLVVGAIQNVSGNGVSVSGSANTVTGQNGSVTGNGNNVGGSGGVIGGYGNTVSGGSNMVVGSGNNVGGTFNVVGGASNVVASNASFVNGGSITIDVASGNNIVGGQSHAFTNSPRNIVGGNAATMTNTWEAIVAGAGLQVESPRSVVAGYANHVTGVYSAIFGQGHTVNATHATAFGLGHYIAGNFGFATGRAAFISHSGATIIKDTSSTTLSSVIADEIVLKANGGIRAFTNDSITSGATMAAGTSSWVAVSDSSTKTGLGIVDGNTLLSRLSNLNVHRYSFKSDETQAVNVGVYADEFNEVFGDILTPKRVGELHGLSHQDVDGVLVAAVKALLVRLEAVEARLPGRPPRLATV